MKRTADKRFGVRDHRMKPLEMIGIFFDAELKWLLIVFFRERVIGTVSVAAESLRPVCSAKRPQAQEFDRFRDHACRGRPKRWPKTKSAAVYAIYA